MWYTHGMDEKPTDRIDIDALERLHKAATPGPWYAGDDDTAGSVTTGDEER